jgi:hypothetical protein
MNAKSFDKVWYLRSIAPRPFGKVYSKTLIHVFHLYGNCMRAASNRRSRKRLEPLRSLARFGISQIEADPEEPEGVARSQLSRCFPGGKYAYHPIKMVYSSNSIILMQIKKLV